MAINISTIEARIREKFPCPPEEIDQIVHDVRVAVSEHLLGNGLRPNDLFQMRLIKQDEKCRDMPPSLQTHLMIYFWEKSLEPSYLSYLQSYYERVIYLHLRLNHSIIL